MVDNRAAGFYGIGGAFNFKSGDPSGTAAKMSQEKYGSEAMYLPPAEGEEDGENLYKRGREKKRRKGTDCKTKRIKP